MSEVYYFLLGLIQGLTEFLPVSSSGHLAVTQYFFDMAKKESLLIEIVAHLGSLFSIAFYYRKAFIKTALSQIEAPAQEGALYKIFVLFISTLPAGLAGLFFKDQITHFFSNMNFIAFGFLFTSFSLILSHFITKKQKPAQDQNWPSIGQALFIGTAQAFALFPGVSRSGSTIAAGLISGLKPKLAAYFSFCSVAPLILAATGLSILKVINGSEALASDAPFHLAILLLSSFFFGWLGLTLVVKFLERNKLHFFAFYLIPLSLFLLTRG